MCVRKKAHHFSILSYLKHFVQGPKTCSRVKVVYRTIPCDFEHDCTPTLPIGMRPVCHCLMAKCSVLSDWTLSPVAPYCRHYIFQYPLLHRPVEDRSIEFIWWSFWILKLYDTFIQWRCSIWIPEDLFGMHRIFSVCITQGTASSLYCARNKE